MDDLDQLIQRREFVRDRAREARTEIARIENQHKAWRTEPLPTAELRANVKRFEEEEANLTQAIREKGGS
jgi:hypothetical protein